MEWNGIQAQMSHDELKSFSDSLHGFSPADICQLCFEALGTNSSKNLSLQDLQATRSKLQTSVSHLTLSIPNVSWDSIGGLDTVKVFSFFIFSIW
jgi:SpoVK/Ycf46/Vps4 family AAA+-type ATPase